MGTPLSRIPPTRGKSRRTTTVLIVDDVREIRACLCRQMGQLGCACVCAGNVAEAWSRLRERDGEIGLAMIDFRLQRRDGADALELLRAIGTEYSHVYRVLMFGAAPAPSLLQTVYTRSEALLEKPWSPSDLEYLLQQVRARACDD